MGLKAVSSTPGGGGGSGVNLPTATWSGLPAANSVTLGTSYLVTDVGVGGSVWYSDGTRWRVWGGFVILGEMQAPVTSNNGTTDTVQVSFGPFPANLLQTNDRIEISANGFKNATTDNATINFRIGTGNSIADTSIGSFTIATIVLSFSAMVGLKLKNASNSFQSFSLTPTAPFATFSATLVSYALPGFSAQYYITLSSKFTSGGFTTLVTENMQARLITCG